MEEASAGFTIMTDDVFGSATIRSMLIAGTEQVM